MPTRYLGPCPQAFLTQKARSLLASPHPLRQSGCSPSPTPPHQASQGLGEAKGPGRRQRGRSADCGPAQGSVMSWRVPRRGRGPGCFSGELEPEEDKARPEAGAMELGSQALLCKLLLLQSSAVLLAGPSELATAGSSVVSESFVSWVSGARAVLRCQSQRMVWTQDRLHDRQRVVHWDLSGGPAGGPPRRLVDMYSAGEQRVYEPRDRGRLLLPPSAFQDGNFSLLIHDRATGAHWDGEKEVLVVERGAPALLTCVNRAPVWTDRHVEEAQQVVHWDRQPPGVPHDRADRLLDLYASGERRAYGPPFLRDRMAVGADAFARGDFSLRIDPLEPADEGTYSCHLHHHYCGLHERRIFHLRVTEPAAPPPPRDSPGNGSSHSGAPGPGAGAAPAPPRPALSCPKALVVAQGRTPIAASRTHAAQRGWPGWGACAVGRAQSLTPPPAPADPTLARGRSIINVIVPEGRAHFFQQLGYVLATLLLFILLLITVVLATRQRRRGGYEYSDKKSGKAKGKDMNMAEFAVATGDQALCRSEDIQLDYKNNILKERAELAHSPLPAKNIDLDKGDWLGHLDPYPTPPILRILKTLVSTLPRVGSSWAGVPQAGAPRQSSGMSALFHPG
ncbi:hypothetical protein MC885_004755 [Smutsia gigantea]|nr:hypothetical protein MC885_004755 [Smutsia gigantea]